MDLGKYGHLTYSTLVHPGDTWDEMWASLTTYVPRVKARLSPDKPFGVSLRLSASSAQTLTDSPDERQKLKAFLEDNGLYLYTVNAFPYGPFKGQVVKLNVYEPDWSTVARAAYTKQVAAILAEVCSPSVNPSIQSPPLGYKGNVTSDAVVEAFAHNVRELAAYLHRLRLSTGRTVTLALEPEPACFLETTEETVAFSPRCFVLSVPCLPWRRNSMSERLKPAKFYAVTLGRSMTSATRQSNSKTFRPACRASSIMIFRCSSCRKRPLFAFRR